MLIDFMFYEFAWYQKMMFNYYISKRLSIFFLNGRNRDFGEKMFSNSLSKWSSKYNHLLFRIFR
jgi:hypothetical protein